MIIKELKELQEEQKALDDHIDFMLKRSKKTTQRWKKIMMCGGSMKDFEDEK